MHAASGPSPFAPGCGGPGEASADGHSLLFPGMEAEALEARRLSGGLLDAACGFCRDLGVEMRLSAHGAIADQLEGFARDAHGIRRLMDNNPRDMSVDDVLEIYRAAF